MAFIVLPDARRRAAAQEATPRADSAWTYVDDAGETISLPARPERIVAAIPMAGGLWDFGIRPVGVWGTTLRPDGSPEVWVGNLDLDAVESIGEVYGEIDLEALVTLQPDLLVNVKWADAPDIWGLPPESVEQIYRIAPVAHVTFVDRPITETIASVQELAVALGADPEAPQVVAARRAFDDASDDLRAAIAEKPGLTAMFVSGTPEAFYVANPSVNSDLLFFKELGLDIVQPDIDEGFFEELSWEQAGKYAADLILVDARQWSSTGAQLKESVPTFAALPAAQADQFGSWKTEFAPSYAAFTPLLEELAATIRAADPDIV
jgi:iron complex transport system substrate-binding protein